MKGPKFPIYNLTSILTMKEAIETFVHDMLAAGLIRPSVSPYASPLILVIRKKMEVEGFALIIGY